MTKQSKEVQAEESKELKGFDLDVEFSKGMVVVKGQHVGKVGYANIEVGGNAKPFVEKVIDKLEEIIPGDQKYLASKIKEAIANLEF